MLLPKPGRQTKVARIIQSSILIAIALFLIAPEPRAEREIVDEIIAVVGDTVVLGSEVANQMRMFLLQNNRQLTGEEEARKLQSDILEQMINDHLLLAAAKLDTSIVIRDEEVEASLDDHIARISKNFPSMDQFEQALTAEGLTLRDLRKQYRDDAKSTLLKQRFIQRKLYNVSVSRHEVEQFFTQYKDSIPSQPEASKLAHILLRVTASKAVEDSVRDFVTALRQRILDGADFATISSRYSSMGYGANGGDLGYMSREDVVPEFARAAFNLNVGEMSGVIRTQFGYHIIRCEGKEEPRLHLRHVLLAVTPTSQDTARLIHLADSLVGAIAQGSDFAELAKAFSEDTESRANGGELGWFTAEHLPVDLTDDVAGWSAVGEIRGPIVSTQGTHILKLLDYTPAKTLDITADFDRIKEMAREEKTGRLVEDWISGLRQKAYIEVHLPQHAN
jgi:peptidyl-prolyl cis-trans isomerase SurA